MFSPWGVSRSIDYGVGRYPVAGAAAHVNGDGAPDLIAAVAAKNALAVMLNSKTINVRGG